jgi:hypothetical protein
MIADHPWVGVGVGGFGEVYPQYRRPGDNETQHVHNLTLELCAELGLPAGGGLGVLFFVIFLGPVFRSKLNEPPWARGAAIGVAALAIQNLVDFTILLPSLLLLGSILRGLLVRTPEIERLPRGSAVRVAALAAVLIAACLAGLSGLAWEARLTAKQSFAAGERESAELHAARATRLAPWNPDGWLYRAELGLDRLELEGPIGDAAWDYSHEAVGFAINMSPVRPSARIVRARLRALEGDLPGAYADAEAASRLYPMQDEYVAARDALARTLDTSMRGLETEP